MDSLAILYKVYVKSNDSGVIIAIDSDAFITDTTDWTEIDSGYTDKYHHAQSQYLEKGLTDIDGAFNYKLVDGVVTERTDEEKAADIPEIEVPIPMYNTTVSNPNLLDNPDFKINQRGQNEYIGVAYTVDRWKISANGKLLLSETPSVIILDTTTGIEFSQSIKGDFAKFSGKTLTLSFGMEDGTVYSTTGTVADDEYTSRTSIATITVKTKTGTYQSGFNYSSISKFFYVNIWIPANSGIETLVLPKWFKLELGSVATQFVPPDPITEKAKCGIPDDTSNYGYRESLRNISAGTEDLTAGESALNTGDIYLVYE